MTARALLLAALCAGLVACGGMRDRAERIFGDDDDAVDPPAELTAFEAAFEPARRWADGIGAGTDEQFLKLVPVADDERVYTAERKGRVLAFEADSGRTLWKTHVWSTALGKEAVDAVVLATS